LALCVGLGWQSRLHGRGIGLQQCLADREQHTTAAAGKETEVPDTNEAAR
jgi:hypothetical protein